MTRCSCMQILRYFSPSKHYPMFAMKRLHVIMVGGEENVNRKRTALETRSMLTLLLGKLSGNNDPYICLKDDIIIDLASHYKRSLAPKIRLLREAIAQRKVVQFQYYAKDGATRRVFEHYRARTARRRRGRTFFHRKYLQCQRIHV